MARTRHRPRRGEPGPNVLELGDTGTYAGPQGGEEPGASVAGDLEAREFGVPQADIPGGKVHIVNPATHPVRPGPDELVIRGADVHKFHGVPPLDLGPYVVPPDAVDDRAEVAPRPEPEPKFEDAVPVYMVPGPERGNVMRVAGYDSITVPAMGSAPARVCNQDRRRIELHLLNESTSIDIRVGTRDDVIEERGALISHFSNSYLDLDTQDELFAITTSASTATLSVITETEQDL